MALLEIVGFYVATATAFYVYLVKSAKPEEAASIVRRIRWQRPRSQAAARVRRVQPHLSR